MTLFDNKSGDDGLPAKERMLAMFAIMLTTTMNVLDGSMINIALPQMTEAFNSSSSVTTWVANSYLLSVAMTLAIYSSLARKIGFRTQFIGGLALFTLASVGCALSTSLPMLIAMRCIQGLGGAATLSIAPALLRTIFPSRLLGRILGINAVLIAACSASAPLFSGLVLANLDWSWLFVINIPLGISAIILSFYYLPLPTRLDRSPIDKIGALFSILMLGSTVLLANSFSLEQKTGFSINSIGYFLLAVISSFVFMYRQRCTDNPLIPLSIFSDYRFTLASVTSLVTFIAQGMTFIALPFYYEAGLGYGPLMSALLFIPWPIAIILIAPQAGKLADQIQPSIVSTTGLIIFSFGLALLACLPEQPSVTNIVWRSFICGLGFGLFQSPNNREMLANVTIEHSSYASGTLAIVRTFGQCLGTAVIGIVLSTVSVGDTVDSIQFSLRIAAGIAVIALLFSSLRLIKQKIRSQTNT